VRLALKRPVTFDGRETSELDVRVQDHAALGHLHRCAMYFTGSGLFGMWEGTPRQDSLRQDSFFDGGSPVHRAVPSVSRGASCQMLAAVAEIERSAAVWELERRPTIFHDRWHAPYLPHDGQKRLKWVSVDGQYRPHPGLPLNFGQREAAASSAPPIPRLKVLGQVRPCTWEVRTDQRTDDEGWQYAVDFYSDESYWLPLLGNFSHVRRRRWQPDFSLKDEDDSSAGDETLQSEATTLLSAKGLSEDAGGSAKQLLELDLGWVPLEPLGRALEAEDWQAPGSLMAAYLERTGATEVSVGPWARGAAAAQVQGKVRSLEMQVPVPPGPMRPERTRVSITWHVVAEPTRVIAESVTMSLDVPYGDCFNVVATDTFSVAPETGRTLMVRQCALEWVKSTWMQAIVEASATGQVIQAGQMFAELVQLHAAAGGAEPMEVRSI